MHYDAHSPLVMSNKTAAEDPALRARNANRTDEIPARQVLVLRLRNEEEERLREEQANRRITWDPKVHDPVNQRTSKKCCVFHRKRMFGESSSDDSSSCSDDDLVDPATDGHGHSGGCCGGTVSATTTETEVKDGPPAAKPKRKRPKCTKEHCYCGTRFS